MTWMKAEQSLAVNVTGVLRIPWPRRQPVRQRPYSPPREGHCILPALARRSYRTYRQHLGQQERRWNTLPLGSGDSSRERLPGEYDGRTGARGEGDSVGAAD